MDKNKSLLIEKIKQAEASKNFDQMLLEAQTAVALSPQDKELMEWLHTAQAEYVNEKLSSALLKDLEEKKDWKGLLAVYEKLLTVFPESDRLKKLLKQVRQKIITTEENERKNYFKQAKQSIDDMVLKGQLDEAEQACYEMLAVDQNNRHFIHQLAHIQHLQDKEMDKLLSLYYQEAVPQLREEYSANRDGFIRV